MHCLPNLQLGPVHTIWTSDIQQQRLPRPKNAFLWLGTLSYDSRSQTNSILKQKYSKLEKTEDANNTHWMSLHINIVWCLDRRFHGWPIYLMLLERSSFARMSFCYFRKPEPMVFQKITLPFSALRISFRKEIQDTDFLTEIYEHP